MFLDLIVSVLHRRLAIMSCLNCFKRALAVNNIKKVTFCETVDAIYYNKMPSDNNICWQRVARDRMRFKRRIKDIDNTISWVFAPQHRNRVYIKTFRT